MHFARVECLGQEKIVELWFSMKFGACIWAKERDTDGQCCRSMHEKSKEQKKLVPVISPDIMEKIHM